MTTFLFHIVQESWRMLLESSVYILFGILVGGLLKVFLSPAYVARHLGSGRFSSVAKAALFGIPIPLCSCGVLPAAASLKKQGANNGATTAFLIATPESGVDSISITYALLDPVMTVARPLAAFASALLAGITENLINPPPKGDWLTADLSCPVDGCCDGADCAPADHAAHHTFWERTASGLKYAATELWGDLAVWFMGGLLLGGVITVLVPDELMVTYLGGGFTAMLLMLAVGIPIYICATASTPIAAALILKGVSPGAALVFLLVGPATNVASLAVLTGLLGRAATLRYLALLSASAVACGLILDRVYGLLGFTARAVAGQAAQFIPYPVELAGALILIALSIKPLQRFLRGLWPKTPGSGGGCDCGCSSSGNSGFPVLPDLRPPPRK
ncbi:MAG: SO_0444 family Cu/Zn efflux transporter [Desulfobulbaceae bacterium]|nr:SO_0444 family Cu/Zn efflux transporter [Desulfobulbaceae bacterium]